MAWLGEWGSRNVRDDGVCCLRGVLVSKTPSKTLICEEIPRQLYGSSKCRDTDTSA